MHTYHPAPDNLQKGMRQFPRIEMCPSAVKPNRPSCIISGTVNIDGQ